MLGLYLFSTLERIMHHSVILSILDPNYPVGLLGGAMLGQTNSTLEWTIILFPSRTSFSHTKGARVRALTIPLLTYFKKVFWISHSCKEILPEGNFGLPSAVAYCLKELWKLLDEVNDSRKKGI